MLFSGSVFVASRSLSAPYPCTPPGCAASQGATLARNLVDDSQAPPTFTWMSRPSPQPPSRTLAMILLPSCPIGWTAWRYPPSDTIVVRPKYSQPFTARDRWTELSSDSFLPPSSLYRASTMIHHIIIILPWTHWHSRASACAEDVTHIRSDWEIFHPRLGSTAHESRRIIRECSKTVTIVTVPYCAHTSPTRRWEDE